MLSCQHLNCNHPRKHGGCVCETYTQCPRQPLPIEDPWLTHNLLDSQRMEQSLIKLNKHIKRHVATTRNGKCRLQNSPWEKYSLMIATKQTKLSMPPYCFCATCYHIVFVQHRFLRTFAVFLQTRHCHVVTMCNWWAPLPRSPTSMTAT